MKRLSSARRKWLARHASLSMRRRVLEKRRGSARRYYASITSLDYREVKLVRMYARGHVRYAHLSGEAKPTPSNLSFKDNYEETAQFISLLRNGLLGPRTLSDLVARKKPHSNSIQHISSYWDFSTIKSITPAAALVIASIYDLASKRGRWIPSAINIDDWDKDVLRLLTGIGFLELSGVESQGRPFLEGDGWRMLRFRSGTLADGAIVGKLLEELCYQQYEEDTRLYDAIIEALVNTLHHAYPSNNTDINQKKYWWLTGYINFTHRLILISALDHGVSIPATLRTWKRYPAYERAWARLRSAVPNPDADDRDGEVIRLAVAAGRSSTEQSNRGRGLPAIEEALDLCKAGHISIYSRRGIYRHEKGRKAIHINARTPFVGTLVAWELRF